MNLITKIALLVCLLSSGVGYSQTSMDDFKWLIGSWKSIDASDMRITKWIKVNDTLFRSYVIKATESGGYTTTSDFYIYLNNKNIYSAIKRYSWILTTATKSSFTFQNDSSEYRQLVWSYENNSEWTSTSHGKNVSISSQKKQLIEDPKFDSLIAHIEELRERRKKESSTPVLKDSWTDKQAPLFQATTIEGEEVILESHIGKVVVVNFWFTTCVPCIKEIPDLNGLADKYSKENIVFLGINWNTEEETRAFLKKYPFKFQLIANRDDIIKKQYLKDQLAFPTTFVIGKNGKVAGVFAGLTAIKELDAAIQASLKSHIRKVQN